jgi:hypothetical protein
VNHELEKYLQKLELKNEIALMLDDSEMIRKILDCYKGLVREHKYTEI